MSESEYESYQSSLAKRAGDFDSNDCFNHIQSHIALHLHESKITIWKLIKVNVLVQTRKQSTRTGRHDLWLQQRRAAPTIHTIPTQTYQINHHSWVPTTVQLTRVHNEDMTASRFGSFRKLFGATSKGSCVDRDANAVCSSVVMRDEKEMQK